jgi:hypothetical protein
MPFAKIAKATPTYFRALRGALCELAMRPILGFFSLCVVQAVRAQSCNVFFENESFSLCSKVVEGLTFGPSQVYEIYGSTPSRSNWELLSTEIELDAVAKVTTINESTYFYAAYLGGNTPHAEFRHVLISLSDGHVLNAGEFSGYEDIDNDGELDFFDYELVSLRETSASDDYEKAKLALINGKLQ